MPILDTQRVTDDLVAAGFPQVHARAVTLKLEEAAQAARSDLVTGAQLEATRADLHNAIGQLESRLGARMAEGEAKQADRMRTNFIALVAVMVGVAGVTLAVARLLG